MLAEIVKNRSQLTATRDRKMVVEIVEAGIRSVLPENIVKSHVAYDSVKDVVTVSQHSIELSGKRVFVVGGGKASGGMARSLEDLLSPRRITAGIVTTKYGNPDFHTEKIKVEQAGHPVPDQSGARSVRSMLDLKAAFSIEGNDLLLCLLSGGGSALMPCPADGITLEEKQRVTGLLLSSGADISEVNCVRKHLSKTKGGQLGRFYAPAQVVSLILSDVIGNDLSAIASGPTYPDPSTFADAIRVLEKYGIKHSSPLLLLRHLEQGRAGELPETPKSLDNCSNFIIGDISVALAGMKNKAVELGLKPFVVTSEQAGETNAAARLRAEEILAGKYSGFDLLILGGETTPRLPDSHGIGGRNQQYAAVSLLELKGYPGPWTMASVGTDGSDFLADIAGTIVDETTLSSLVAQDIDAYAYVDRYDSYGLLAQTKDSLVVTGNTGTNVGDVVVYKLGGRS